MKLALVSPYDFAYPGGVTQHVAALAEHARRQGHEVHIIAPSSDDENEPVLHDSAYVHRIGRVVPIPANGSIARITLSLRAYLQVKRLLSEQQFDLIHLHEPMMPALPLTVLRHSGTTNIGTFHAYGSTALTYFYSKPILRPFFGKLHGHIAVSESAREFVGEYFSSDYRIIPNGIDFDRFSAPQERPAWLVEERPTVLFVGRLEKRKGLRFLLRAWGTVREALPEARLVVVGRGRGLEGYRRYATKHGWSDADVHLAGYVAPADLPAYYQAAQVFCAPNTGQESFGIVLLEAMAAAVPVVASDIPGFREVVAAGVAGDGLLVPRAESAPLAEALLLLLKNPLLARQMGTRGRRKARQYDWAVVSGHVMAYYDEVLARRARVSDAQPARLSKMRRMAGLLTPRA